MATLSQLSPVDKKHWELHLKAVMKDTPTLTKEVEVFLKGGELPKLKHPAEIHDYLEKPETRLTLEVL